jgi:PAS domain S-box-containing protein
MVSTDLSDSLPAPPAETIACINAMANPAAIVGPDHRIVHVNPAYQSRFGFSGRDICGQACYEVFRNRSEPCPENEIPCPIRKALKEGRPTIVTHSYYKADGQEVCLKVEGTPLRDEYGNVTRVVKLIDFATP